METSSKTLILHICSSKISTILEVLRTYFLFRDFRSFIFNFWNVGAQHFEISKRSILWKHEKWETRIGHPLIVNWRNLQKLGYEILDIDQKAWNENLPNRTNFLFLVRESISPINNLPTSPHTAQRRPHPFFPPPSLPAGRPWALRHQQWTADHYESTN